ncbi:DNA cytosine methyltransferase [Parapedobacter sp. ISTM3]|uniref:DNA cytosine methyltransferase n=1 Tax=Parapedobacter sp. ISTM3 TaxID=2800130 RepID=UPI0019053F65|nr:DNA cytosine methyltransferase [Parapedobacter sp. ISTM3]MBK1439867.1 DNA cytosine methyltransferase [Parapedobacter sp. ISTM3]
MRKVRHGSLFSGIGGFDLAAEWCGWENVFHCENDGFCNSILNYYWPETVCIENIIGYDWEKWRTKVDVLSGGWPCQRYSVAGKRTGNEPLKDQLLEAIRNIRPAWCVLENVYGFISKPFAHEHRLLCEQLEGMGYEVQTFDIDAASCGLPTVERHVWIVATSCGKRLTWNGEEAVPDLSGTSEPFQRGYQGAFDRWELPESRVCELGEGVPDELDITSIPKKRWHSQSLHAYGNAIPPQVAYFIFREIQSVMRSP